MPTQIEPRLAEQALVAMGISAQDFHAIRSAPSFEGAQAALASLKDKAKKGYKKAAFDLHPDRTGGDALKTEVFKVLAQVRADIEALQVHRQPAIPMPIPVQVVVVHPVQVQTPGVGRPPPGHPAANGGVRQWPGGPASASAAASAATMNPFVSVRFVKR